MENVWRVLLPAEVGESFDVYVNGVQQVQHVDYELCGRELWFRREILKEGNLGVARWASMFLGIAGTYRQNDSVDVVYELGGKRLVANDLKLISPNEEI
tara:strand:- start:67 stop:363 length:297 start_codon:yes stop_codon:yes gene_type:complete